MDTFEKDMRSLWVAIDERGKRVDERVAKVEDKVDGMDIGAGLMANRISDLEKERDSLRDDVVYLKSQSMRNNLVFTGIPEDGGHESFEVTERKLRDHLHTVMKVAKETAQGIRFERVHRSPSAPTPGKTRSIVAKFTYFQDRELVRRQYKELINTKYNVFEQFPPEVVAKRRRLLPKMKEARRQNKKAWIAYDTLYIDGVAVKE
ncbi:uncharacterized protein LOC128549767 [Mercenaria mercenaria]|uniref:uncharacterized protein LOC128549767 n=1 Tax=Mercenaria mercenaria TaxID=6596 RepID=UPI00234F96DB|nr:uncharacterized protein LOC128549767 [Mercenaria mercenaria]